MKNGIKIQNISAVRLYEYIVGDRNKLKTEDGVLPFSILTDYLIEQKIFEKDAEFTKNLVMVNFDYDYLEDDKIKEEITVRHKKAKITKEQIRTKLYKEGFKLKYKDGVIHYKPLYRTSNKAKDGGEVFINKDYFDDVDNYMCMGMKSDKIKDGKPTKLVELLAYKSLIASGCIRRVRIKPSEILILDDIVSIKKQDIESVELVGEIAKVISKKGEVKNTLFDGQALLDDSLFTDDSGMMVLRNHFFKACGFRTDIQKFMKDWCERTNHDYNSYQVKDFFRQKKNIKNIKMITTINATKWLKFNYLFEDNKEICKYWFDFIKQTDFYFGVVKTDHPSKYGNRQRMSYQMSNDLPLTYDDTAKVYDFSLKYLQRLKNDNEEFKKYLYDNTDEVNGYDMIYDLVTQYPSMFHSDLVNKFRTDLIYGLKQELLNGKPRVEGDNLTVCGNPYAMLLHSVGELDIKIPSDNCFVEREDCIEVYTKRFKDGEYLAGFRSPNNSPNNVCYYQNKYSEPMTKYFSKFSKNIMAVNCIQTDVQDRNCGQDHDSDFNLVTNDETVVKNAKYCIENFPTMVNNIPLSDREYENTIENIADIDNQIAKSGEAIGESSNLAQLALSYYWDEYSNGDDANKNMLQKYKNIFVEMSVIAQIAIDSSKRKYNINYEKEIRRNHFTSKYPRFFINIKDDLKILVGKELKKVEIDDLEKKPNKKEYEKKIELNKSIDKIRLDIKCPMEYVQDIVVVDEKKHLVRFKNLKYISDIDLQQNDYRQINKIIKLVNNWSKMTQTEIIADNGKTYFEYQNQKVMDDIIAKIQRMKILPATMNRALRHVFGTNVKGETTKLASKNKKKLLMCLYKSNKEIFLKQFQDIDISKKDKKIDKKAKINIA